MNHLMALPDTHPARPHSSLGWAPLVILPPLSISLRQILAPWVFMWILAGSIFFGFKWWTLRRAIDRGVASTLFRRIAFLFLWPGMDAVRFLDPHFTAEKPVTGQWLFALAKTAFGAALLWGAARSVGNGWAAGWIAMIGFIFVLHFGIFHLLALFWRRYGIDARPIMKWPALVHSLGDFWGNRWNAGFSDLAFVLLFTRLAAFMPPRIATLIIFLISGLIHELVITLPAQGGYGLPTFYFAIQGAGMLIERTRLGSRLKLRRTARGRIFAISVVALPSFALFPEPFVLRVMVPFFQFIKAL
jgi:Membrane bound O-acyl transferase family